MNRSGNRWRRLVLGCALALTALAGGARGADPFLLQRNQMVDREIVAAGVKDPRVIQSMRDTLRHEFVEARLRPNAYYDMALAIGNAQTISPPFIVAYMTEQLLPKPTDKVLEIGTGSGYQAAVLSPLVKDVYTIEIVEPLGQRADRTLKRLKYENVHTKIGDGYQGWPEHAPFDKIIVTCSPEEVPTKLVEQLKEGGRMVVPVGERYQQTLFLFEKKDGKLNKVALLPMLFVPMTGAAEEGRVVLPDPAHPTINNGGFETLAKGGAAGADGGKPADELLNASQPRGGATAGAADLGPFGWHYQRQLRVVSGSDAREGNRYVTFTNSEPGRGAQALQGLAVDGRKVTRLNLSAWVKGANIRQGENLEQLPVIAITFFDEARAQIAVAGLGPWRDTFPWTQVTKAIPVPPRAREAIIRIGLTGATGEISFDDVSVTPAK